MVWGSDGYCGTHHVPSTKAFPPLNCTAPPDPGLDPGTPPLTKKNITILLPSLRMKYPPVEPNPASDLKDHPTLVGCVGRPVAGAMG
jgi:hypothetical protein